MRYHFRRVSFPESLSPDSPEAALDKSMDERRSGFP
jgi:hypothetical protein